MKLNSLLLLAAGALALAGCSSTPAKVDTGAIHARTFSFVTTRPQQPDFAEKRKAVHMMIQDGITHNLAARGVSRVEQGGDITVAYLVIVGNNATTTSINDYFGDRDDAMALHEKAHDAYTGSKNPNYFEAGTLVIDIIDSKTFKLLKRGYATRPLLKNVTDDVRSAHIQEVVDKVLQGARLEP